jgi:signal transduction histidine kinase
MSLRWKYLIAAGLSILVPFLAYLLLDARLTHSFLIQDHVASLRLAAELLQSSLDVCEADCPRRAQRLLGGFAASHPDLDIMLLDEKFTVLAATRPAVLGRIWREEGIGRVLRGETDFSWAIMQHHGEPVLDVTRPWMDSAGVPQGAIHIGRSLKVVDQRVGRTRLRHAAFVGIVALVVGLFLTVIVYRTVIRRLGRLDAELRQLHAPHGERAVELEGGGDEIDRLSAGLRCLVGDLAASADRLQVALEEKGRLLLRVEHFNEELAAEVERTRQELLAVQQELLRAEQVATLGKLAAGLAHELRNPLFIIRGSAESFRRHHPVAAGLASDIIEEVDRLDAIISRLMDLARLSGLASVRVDLSGLLQEVAAEAERAEVSGRGVGFRLELEGALHTLGDRDYLRQALTHLADNARRAAPPRSQVAIGLRRSEPGWLLVTVEDAGCGIAAEDLPRIFEPFFSRTPGGTGLGLCAAKKIIDLHGGSIEVASAPGKGTRFSVRLREAPCREGPA